MSDEPQDVLRRLHNADAHFRYLDRAWRGGGVAFPRPRESYVYAAPGDVRVYGAPDPSIDRAITGFRTEYARYQDASGLPHISNRHQRDRRFFQGWLEAAAKELGEQQLRQMYSIAWHMRWRYLGERRRRDRTPPADRQLAGLARYLASWLVFTSDAPYAVIAEISSGEQALPGVSVTQFTRSVSTRPPPEEPPPVLPPGGQQAPDAGTPPQGLGPRHPPLRGRLPDPAIVYTTWRPWSEARPAHRDPSDFDLARAEFSASTGYDLKTELLDESVTTGPVEGVGGHPILAIIRKFRPPSETPRRTDDVTPGEFYQMLLKRKEERNQDLEEIVRKAVEFLLEGAREFEAALRDEDWTTIRPVVETALRSLLAEHRLQNSQPLRQLAYEVFGLDRPWRSNDTLTAVILGASLVISIATAGLASPLVATITAATLAAIQIGAELRFALEESAQRRLINRAALIDEGLRVAERRDEELRLGDLTAKVALTALTFLLPGVVARAAGRFWQRGFTRRVVERTESDDLVLRSAPRQTRGPRVGAANQAGPANRLRERPVRGPTDPVVQNRATGQTPQPPQQPAVAAQAQAVPRTSAPRRPRPGTSQGEPGTTGTSAVPIRRSPGEVISSLSELTAEQSRRLERIQRRLAAIGIDPAPERLLRYLQAQQRAGRTIDEAMRAAFSDMERRAQIRLGEHLPGARVRGGRAIEVEGRPEIVMPANRTARGRIDYRSSDLSREAFEYRREYNYWGDRNVAVGEYRDADGVLRIVRVLSDRTGHAERVLVRTLENQGIDPRRITRIYTELSPCEYAHCREFLLREVPNARVTWSFDYEIGPGFSAEIRATGVDDRRIRVLREGSLERPHSEQQ